jgi:tetratricopeptide (TPR) repeat protein
MKKQLGLALACLWLAAAPVSAQTAPSTPSTPSTPSKLSPPDAASGLAQARAAQDTVPVSALDSSLFYQLLLAEITSQEGEPGSGFALLMDAARKTNDPQLYQRATDLALQSRSGESALQAARAWKQALPASREANRYLLQILIALNRIPETAEPLKTEIRMAPEDKRASVIHAVPQAYARVSDKKLAATVIESALADYLKPPATASAAWTSLARVRAAAGDQQGALTAAQRGLEADAQSEAPLIVALELMSPKLPQAEKLLQNYLNNPTRAARPEIRLAYAKALLEAQRYAESSAQLKLVTRDKPELAESWLILGSLQLHDKQLAEAQTSLERYIALAAKQGEAQADPSRGLDQAYLSLADLAEKRKDYAAAQSWLGKIETPSVLAAAQVRRASILASQGRLEEGRQLIGQLPDSSPEEARLKLNAEVGLLREFKHYQPAHALLAQALVKTPEDTELLYDQALLAEKLNRPDEMERLLRQVIALKPDFHHAYNALGYSLADRNTRLPEARELIQKALSYAPADPFISDSLGWVEFRMGRSAEAVKIFEAAYQARQDPEIAAHYGEVLWSLGQRERALAIWKEGQRLSPDNETLLETLKRLRIKL